MSIAALVAALAAWLFADVLFRDHVFAYRDTAYLYQPLYRFVETQWSTGRLPLWNPLENCGVPLAANPIAAVFYPGKLLFRLPIGFEAAFRAYVVLHVLLAAWMSYLLARRWKCSVHAAALAAIAYAFGGCVLFQYCNVIYLVSAAWLPGALAAADRALVDGCRRGALTCAGALALMILGGDPQTAYHALLLIGLYGFLLWRADRARGVTQAPGRLAGWLMIFVATMVLAAVQILPASELSRRSERAAFESPRSVWELVALFSEDHPDNGADAAEWAAGLRVEPGRPTSHDVGTYQFSVSPWRIAELVWPNVSGRSFPINRRWLTAVPAEGRVWVPTLYLGTIPLVLGLSAFGLRRTATPIPWMSWCVVIGIVASLGAYGPGWIAAEAVRALAGDKVDSLPFGGGFGGLYWLFNVVLPGYVQFRYPAKWLVVAALGISQLAAFGFDAVIGGESRRAAKLFAALAAVSLIGLIVAVMVRPWWSSWLAGASADSLFGPLDVSGAWRDLAGAFLQTALIAGVGQFLFRRPSVVVSRGVVVVMLVATGLDLAAANRWLILTVPMNGTVPSSSMRAEVERSRHATDRIPMRGYRAPYWLPERWKETSDLHRASEAVAWNRDTLWPRYNLDAEVGLVAVVGTLNALDYSALVPILHREANARAESNVAAAKAPALDLVGAAWLIQPQPGTGNAELVEREVARPRTWIASDVEFVPAIDERNVVAVRHRTEEVLTRLGNKESQAQLAVVETNDPPTDVFQEQDAGVLNVGGERCELVHDDVEELEIHVVLARPSLLVLADAYDPNWIATNVSTGESLDVLRVNRVLRGVWLPAGEHRVMFAYRPTWLYVGGAISALVWFGCGFLLVACVCRGVSSRRGGVSTRHHAPGLVPSHSPN